MSEAQPSTVNDLADGFWESILELSPTTATVYGDERYDDQLPDPGPVGRAKARSHESTVPRPQRCPPMASRSRSASRSTWSA